MSTDAGLLLRYRRGLQTTTDPATFSLVDTAADDYVIYFFEVHVLRQVFFGLRFVPFVIHEAAAFLIGDFDDLPDKAPAVGILDVNEVLPDDFSLTPCASIVPLRFKTKTYCSPSMKGPSGLVNSARATALPAFL